MPATVIEAWRAGVPFGEYVIQRTLLYRVEQAYLISRDNGLLIGHAHHEASRIKDSDAVSAMFTAIQDFIKESFSPDRSGRLETADMGEFTLWAVHGPHALLVCVIRGVPPRSLRADLSAILERIHFRHGDSIREYSGDTSTVPGVEEELADCLRFEALKPADAGKRRWSVPLIIILLLLAALLAYFAFNGWQVRQQRLALQDAVDETPGLYVSSIERDSGVFVIRGLRDPAASNVEDLAIRAGLAPNELAADLRPFQSLDPEIIYLRAVAVLNAPGSVSVMPGANGLVLTGTASQAWIDATQQKAAAGSLGLAIDLSDVASSDLLRLQADIATIANEKFYFAEGIDLHEPDAARLDQHVMTVKRLAGDAERLGASLRIAVVGHTDAVGSTDFNTRLADRRANIAADLLIEQGIDQNHVTRSRSVDPGEYSAPVPELRHVAVQLELQLRDNSGQPAAE